MSSEPKLTRRERESIIFQYLKGQPNPLYEVEETNHGKYVVKQKQIEIEEEEEKPEPKQKKPIEQSKPSKQQLKRERRRANRRAKADAYKILEQLNRLLNVQDEPNNESSDDEQADVGYEPSIIEQQYKAPQIIEQPNLNNQPGPLSFRRKRLRF